MIKTNNGTLIATGSKHDIMADISFIIVSLFKKDVINKKDLYFLFKLILNEINKKNNNNDKEKLLKMLDDIDPKLKNMFKELF